MPHQNMNVVLPVIECLEVWWAAAVAAAASQYFSSEEGSSGLWNSYRFFDLFRFSDLTLLRL